MRTYNFTVRATDDLGAYADRNFSIDVNNTDFDRFLIVSAGTGVYYRSKTGLGGSWVREELSFNLPNKQTDNVNGVFFAKDRWFIRRQSNYSYYTSFDGVLWSEQPIAGQSSGAVSSRLDWDSTNNRWVFVESSGSGFIVEALNEAFTVNTSIYANVFNNFNFVESVHVFDSGDKVAVMTSSTGSPTTKRITVVDLSSGTLISQTDISTFCSNLTLYVSDGILVLGGGGAFRVSFDNGVTWLTRDDAITNDSSLIYSNGYFIYYDRDNSRLRRTVDLGLTWTDGITGFVFGSSTPTVLKAYQGNLVMMARTTTYNLANFNYDGTVGSYFPNEFPNLTLDPVSLDTLNTVIGVRIES